MPHGLSNWTYRNVIDFLKQHSFVFKEDKIGSHELWLNEQFQLTVDIDFKNNSYAYPLRTLETMIKNSGLDKKHWRKWAETGGYCCK